MNYDMIMLKNAVRMNKSAKILSRELQRLAIQSYDTLHWRDGTMGQVAAMGALTQDISRLRLFWDSVVGALKRISPAERALLVAVYLKCCDKQRLADRFGVSVSTVYRKLFVARKHFCAALQKMGCDEQWFQQNYGDFDWLVRRR